jgi:hypothetical protein
MKFLTVFFALCLMTLPVEAQRGGGGGFHGGGGGFHGGGGGFHGGGGGFHGGGGGFHGGGGGFHGGSGGFHSGSGFRGNPGFHGGLHNAPMGGFHNAPVGGFHNPPVGGFRTKPGFSGGFHNAPGGGFHGGGFHGGRSHVVISPFFGFGFGDPFFPYYYPAPIYPAPVYSNPPYDDESNYTVSGQLQQVPPAPSVQEVPSIPSAATTSGVPVVVVLKDGRRIEAPGYALVGTTLWILSPQDASKILLSDVDTEGTRKANLERGVDVVIPVTVNPSNR